MNISSVYAAYQPGSPGLRQGGDVDAKIRSLEQKLQQLNEKKEKAVQCKDEKEIQKLQKQIREIEEQIRQLKQQEKRKDKEAASDMPGSPETAQKPSDAGKYIDHYG